MSRINHEEYKVLKGLENQWKWVARDSDGNRVGDLFAYPEKPLKNRDIGGWVYGRWFHSVDNHLFQFIQWEDSEPYNIAELIEEYDNWVKDYKADWNKVFGRKESEETEVKSKRELIEKWESAIEAAEFYGKGTEDRLIEYMRDFVGDLKRLDEPETLSPEWIDDHAYAVAYDGMPDQTEVVYVDDLQNLIVPKREELESKIKVLIEAYKQEDGAYSNPENGWIGGFIEDLENLVEREQKFYVLNSEGETMIRKNDSGIRTSSGFKIRNGFEGENYKFTEQEIKDYDERFWPFAVKVEEM